MLAHADDWLLSVAFGRMRAVTVKKRMKRWNVCRLVNVWYSTRMVNLETIVPKGGALAFGFYLEETHDDAVLLHFCQIDFYLTAGVLFWRSIFKEDNVDEASREMTR